MSVMRIVRVCVIISKLFSVCSGEIGDKIKPSPAGLGRGAEQLFMGCYNPDGWWICSFKNHSGKVN